jgi:hypothetical protein
MFRVRLKEIAAPVLIPVLLLLGACDPHAEEIAAVQQTIVRDVANAGSTGSREDLPLAEFVLDEFAAANPSVSWASAVLPKDDPDRAAMIGIHALVTPGQVGFPKVKLRFKYDPATQKVTYYDAVAGKKPLADKAGRRVLLAGAYEALKARVDQAKAEAKAKADAKAKKKKKKGNAA